VSRCRDAADLSALRYAIALARDEAGPTEERYRDIRFTGAKAWALWGALLRNADEPVADGGQWNVRRNLVVNRSAAVAYLREVASRHEGGADRELSDAADAYEKVIELARAFKPGGAAKDMDKRRALAEKVDRMAAAELRAVAHLAKAVDAMQAARPVVLTGECLCGAVKYRVDGSIRQGNFCDCPGCRRASGALRVPWIVVVRKDLKVTTGQLQRVRGDKARYRKCEAHGERAICPACGTNLFWYGDRGDSVDIAAWTLDDLSVFKPDQAR
jgi:hypothetical protein